MKTFLWFIGAFIVLALFFTTTGIIGDGCNTVKKEFQPSALLKKYEYFKDLSAGIDKKRADIEMYREDLKDYDPADKEDRFNLQQRKSELMGIISIHNDMCADYNAAMAKFNYAFCNVGTLPAGATVPLPREHKTYISSLKQN